MPKWVWIFVILNVLIFFLVIGGIIGGLFAVGGAITCFTIANGTKPNAKKILFCIIATVACWVGAAIISTLMIVIRDWDILTAQSVIQNCFSFIC